MNSRDAHNMVKAETRTLKQRKQAWDAAQGEQLATLEAPIPKMNVKTTDYPPNPKLEGMSLKLRERSRITEWPTPQRPVLLSTLPEARNVGRAFRRYADGTLCIDDAVLKLKHLVGKFNDRVAPLHEHEALLVSAVFPDVTFENLPKRIVEIKAPLTTNERSLIQRRLPIRPRELPGSQSL